MCMKSVLPKTKRGEDRPFVPPYKREPAQASSLETADTVKAVPRPHGGARALVPLQRLSEDMQSVADAVARKSMKVPPVFCSVGSVWFTFQENKYVLEAESQGSDVIIATPVDVPVKQPLSMYAGWQGHTTQSHELAVFKWGPNRFNIPLPQFAALFKEHAAAPFFVFQVRPRFVH